MKFEQLKVRAIRHIVTFPETVAPLEFFYENVRIFDHLRRIVGNWVFRAGDPYHPAARRSDTGTGGAYSSK